MQLMNIPWLSAVAFLKFLYQKVREYLNGDGKAGPQKMQFLKSYSTPRGAASPLAPSLRSQTPPSTDRPLLLRQMHFSDTQEAEKSGAFSGQESLETCKVVLPQERKAAWRSAEFYLVVVRKKCGREEMGAIAFIYYHSSALQ